MLIFSISFASRADELQPADDTITITAIKHATLPQDTPESITLLGSHTLENARADDFSDFAALVPGLSYIDSGPGNKRYALRGLQSPGEPEVALYYDEIPVRGITGPSLDTGDSQPDIKLWDVDRVEVLRGPQGTLYGNGSEGGAIRIISKRPRLDSFEADSQVLGSVTDGGGPSYRVNEMVNLPIVDGRLAIRLVGYYRNEGGWIDDIQRPDIAIPQINAKNLNTEESWGDRASAVLRLNDDWTVTGIAYYQHLHTASSFETYPGFAVPGDPYVSKAFVRTPWRDESQMYNLIINGDLGWAEFVADGSYQYRTVDRTTDTTRYLLSQFGCNAFNWNHSCFGPKLVPAGAFAHDQVGAWNGEVRLASPDQDKKLQWVIGTNIQFADTVRGSQIAKTDSQGLVDFDSNGIALSRLFARSNDDSFEKYAVFGEGSYPVLDHLSATLGARWFYNRRTDQQTILQQFFPGQPTGEEPFQESSESHLYKKFELSTDLLPRTLLYLQAAQGFRAGGPNFPGGFTMSAPPYRGDSVWDYELGWKFSTNDDRFTWNGALFRLEWSHIQELVPTALFAYIVNAGSARSDGAESEFAVHLPGGWSLTAGGTYNEARLIGSQPASSIPTAVLRDGESLANVPKWSLSGGVAYQRAITAGYTLGGRFDLTFQTGRGSLVTVDNPAYFRTDDYALAALHFTLDAPDGWSASLDVDNLFNRYAELSAKPLDSNLVDTITAARPRTIMLGARKTF